MRIGYRDILSVGGLVRLQFLALSGIVVSQVLGRTEIASKLFTLTFFLTLLIWLTQAAENVSTNGVVALLTVMLSGISVLGNALLTLTPVSLSYFRKWIMLCTTVLFLGAMGDHRPSRKEIALIFRGSTVLALFLVGMYGAAPREMYLLNGRVSSYLTFRFTNPNLTAVFLAAISMLQGIQAVKARGIKQLLHGLLAAVLVWFLIQTQSRNGLLMMTFFCLVWCLAMLGTGIALRGWIRSAAAVFPLIFALGYLLLVHTPLIQRLFLFLSGEGKTLDSRVWIWELSLKNFSASPILGAYSQISDGTGMSQMHNSHVDVLASYGIVPFFLTCWLLYRLLGTVGKGRTAYLCRMAFLSMLLAGMGEAMLFSGGMGIYLFFGFLQMLGNVDHEDGVP